MARDFSRRDFIAGVLGTGVLSAAITYAVPGGHVSEAELKFVTGTDPTGARDLLIAIWNSANPNSRVLPDIVTGPTADQRSGIRSRVERSQADILNVDIIDIPYFRAQGFLTPVTLNPSDFLPKTLVASQLGRPDPLAPYWAAPFNTDVGMTFQRGVPVDADVPELASIFDTIVQARSGEFAGQLKSVSSSFYEAFVVNVLEHALSRGTSDDGAVLSPNGLPSLDLQLWKNSLRPLSEALQEGKITTCDGEDDTTSKFRGPPSLGFMRNWPVKYREMQQDPPDADVRASRAALGKLPRGVLGGQSLALARTSSKLEQAQKFIDFLTSANSQRILASYGLAASHNEAYTDKNLNAFNPNLQTVKGAVEGAYLRPVHENYRLFSDLVVSNVRPFLEDGQSLTTQFIEDIKTTLKLS